MKTLAMMIFLFPCILIAQISPAPSLAPAMPSAVPVPPDWLSSLILHYPKLSLIVFLVGGLRLTLKPLFSFLHVILPAWGLVSYDQDITAIEQSKPMKAIYFVLDYLGSIKMPVAQVPVINNPQT